MSILYFFAELFYGVLYYLIKYRRKVINENLLNSFPEYSSTERNLIAKKFYRNFAYLVFENIKTISISKDELIKRVEVKNIELVEDQMAQGKAIVVLTGHFCNWEWLLLRCSIASNYPIDAVYKEINIPSFEKLLIEWRSQFGANPVEMRDLMRSLVRRKGMARTIAMIADQTPLPDVINYWQVILNQETGFFTGPDKVAKLLNAPVYFVDMRRLKRGFYEISFEKIAYPPYGNEGFEIIEKYAKRIEKRIIDKPEDWLWSHRRWKYKKNKDPKKR